MILHYRVTVNYKFTETDNHNMNYTAITIQGKEVGLKFGMPSFRIISEKMEKLMGYDDENLNETGIAVVLYAGYVNNCMLKDISPELTLEHFSDYTESAIINGDAKQIQGAIDVWVNSQFMQKAVENAKEVNEPKKKSTGTKSSRKPSVK